LKKRRFREGEIPTASMADIAFLLLIFFLVTTTIDTDKGIGLVLPAEGQEMEVHKSNILTCLINSSGQVLLGKEPVKIRDIARIVRERIQQNPRLTISVKAHGKAEYSSYVEVLDQLKLANASRISIANTE